MKKIYIALSFVLAFASAQSQDKDTKTADKLYNQYQYIKAAKEYLKLTDKGKSDQYIQKQLGDCYYNIFNAKEASKWYAQAIASKQQDAETYFRYAQMLKANNNYAEATKQLQKFAELAPNDKRAQNVQNEDNYLKTLLGSSKLFDVKSISINSKYSDFGAYLKDNTIYFASARNATRKNYQWNDQPFLDLYQTDYKDNAATANPTAIATLNTPYHEGPVTISDDGNTMYFSRESFFENKFEKTKDNKTKLGKMYIYKASKVDGAWGNVTSTNLNDKLCNTSSPSLSKDGKTLYFVSDRTGSLGNTDIWKASLNADGTFGTPENLGSNVNTEGNELSAFIADDNTLYFASNGRQGLGGLDVFAYNTNAFEAAINVGKPVNSEKDDFGFTFNQAQNVAFMSSNRDGGLGDDDIYQAIPYCELNLIVLAKDNKTGNSLAGAKMSVLDTNKNVVATGLSDDMGQAKFKADCDKPYTINVEKEGYENAIISLDKSKNTAEVVVSLEPVKAIVTEKEVILNEIKFEYDKANITQEGAFELDKLVAVMVEYPNMVIFAKSHSDSRGADAYNLNLSDRRAKATVQYVMSKGIAQDRISGKGMGETEPKVPCLDNCTEEDHAQNRRSEFLIVKK
jgi:outer membrane protein OmpA-like peptidoglycan-associated protein